jgi:hypothetical protein
MFLQRRFNKMKALKILLFGCLLFLANSAWSQVVVNYNPPAWGPAGYTEVRYYYLPDVEAYYDVSTAQFIYLSNGVWGHYTVLPARYKTYNLYRGYKVVMTDYRGSAPYIYYPQYKVKYHKGYKGGPQKTVGSGPGRGHGSKIPYSKAPATRPSNNGNGSHPSNVRPSNNGNGGHPNGGGNSGHGGGGHPKSGNSGHGGGGKGHGK